MKPNALWAAICLVLLMKPCLNRERGPGAERPLADAYMQNLDIRPKVTGQTKFDEMRGLVAPQKKASIGAAALPR